MVKLDINCIRLSECGRGKTLMQSVFETCTPSGILRDNKLVLPNHLIETTLREKYDGLYELDLEFMLNSISHRSKYTMIVNDL